MNEDKNRTLDHSEESFAKEALENNTSPTDITLAIMLARANAADLSDNPKMVLEEMGKVGRVINSIFRNLR